MLLPRDRLQILSLCLRLPVNTRPHSRSKGRYQPGQSDINVEFEIEISEWYQGRVNFEISGNLTWKFQALDISRKRCWRGLQCTPLLAPCRKAADLMWWEMWPMFCDVFILSFWRKMLAYFLKVLFSSLSVFTGSWTKTAKFTTWKLSKLQLFDYFIKHH